MSSNPTPLFSSFSRLATKFQGLDSLQLDWALNGSTPMELAERREVIETTFDRVVAFLEDLRSVSVVRRAYASGGFELGSLRPDAPAFLEGDAEV